MSNRRRLRKVRVELPSGGYVEYRDKLMAGDKFAVQDSVSLVFQDGGNRASLGLLNDQRNALLGRIITDWSFGQTPAQLSQLQAADVVIGNALDIDDYNVLSDAVQPLLDKISGVTPTVANPKAK